MPVQTEERAFDVIPFEVSCILLLMIQNVESMSRISKETGRNWAQGHLGTFTRVGLLSPHNHRAITHQPSTWTGTYLGVEVAIKEVLPSTEYDVSTVGDLLYVI